VKRVRHLAPLTARDRMAPMDSEGLTARQQELFGQDVFWISMHDEVIALADMSRQYLQNVLDTLRRDASIWHENQLTIQAAWISGEDDLGVPPTPTPRELFAAATEAPTASAWLEDTVLVKAIFTLLETMRREDPAGRHTCLRCDVELYVVELYEVEDPEVTHIIWQCPTCGARVRQERPREGVDVEQFMDPAGGHSWPS
jgi:hypothetical protein